MNQGHLASSPAHLSIRQTDSREVLEVKHRRLLYPGINLVTCVGKHQPYHTSPHLTHHSTLPGQAKLGFRNQDCV